MSNLLDKIKAIKKIIKSDDFMILHTKNGYSKLLSTYKDTQRASDLMIYAAMKANGVDILKKDQ